MIPDIGFTFLFLALSASFFQVSFCVLSTQFKIFNINNTNLLKTQKSLTLGVVAFCCLSLLCLVYSFIVSDFSVENVYRNSHQLKPLIYKISGAWGNHEGSILLLATILAFYSFAFSRLSKIDDKSKVIVLAVQSFITFGILLFIVFTSNPFLRIFPIPDAGIGLNPILQDIGLAAHPPMLYTGYIGFSLVFSLSIAGLLREKIDKDFARFLRPWLTFSWSFLTLGIGLGSWWAYRELGWGGYWFWDSVENVSLMPWLCATALLHSTIMLQKTGSFKLWSSFLAILSFVFCLLGIFLVRSGILTSVHSFANDPDRGIFIILLFLIIGGFGFTVFAIKSLKIKSQDVNFDLRSRSGFVVINNFIFCLALFIVSLGTLYPIILQLLFSSSISVGAPYYKSLLSPVVIILLSLMIFVPALKLQTFKKLGKDSIIKLFISMALSILLSALLFFIGFEIVTFLAILLSLGVIFSAISYFKKPRNNSNQSLKDAFSYYSMFLAHVGFSIIILSICVNSLMSKTIQSNVTIGEEIEVNSYKVKFEKVDHGYGKNYLTRIGVFKITSGDKVSYLKPESRYYPVTDQNTSEAAIKHSFFSDLYVVLGEKNDENSFSLRIYHKFFISFIWLGCFMMFLSGIVYLFKSYHLDRSSKALLE